jgi:hypothetical protein
MLGQIIFFSAKIEQSSTIYKQEGKTNRKYDQYYIINFKMTQPQRRQFRKILGFLTLS